MNSYHVSKPDEIMKTAARKIGYSGRKFKISSSIPSRLDSFWDGGSRDYYYFYQPATGEILPVGSNHPEFEADQPRELKRLPEGLILIEQKPNLIPRTASLKPFGSAKILTDHWNIFSSLPDIKKMFNIF